MATKKVTKPDEGDVLKTKLETAINEAMDNAIGALFASLLELGVSSDILQQATVKMMDKIEAKNDNPAKG
jgi:hypothetical protein